MTENRTAFWQQIPKLQERTASKSERRHRGACGLPAFAVKLVDSGLPAFERPVAVSCHSFRRPGRGANGGFLVESGITFSVGTYSRADVYFLI